MKNDKTTFPQCSLKRSDLVHVMDVGAVAKQCLNDIERTKLNGS